MAVVVAVGAVFALGAFLLLWSMRNDQEATDRVPQSTWDVQTANQFSKSIEQPGMVVINVHVPFEGEIAGTDLNIAYNRIADDPRLPKNLDAPIALYCRSGRMSEIAARDLVDSGRSNVVELDGGMNAWLASGRQLVGGG